MMPLAVGGPTSGFVGLHTQPSSLRTVVAHAAKTLHRSHRKRDPRFPGVHSGGFLLEERPTLTEHTPAAPEAASLSLEQHERFLFDLSIHGFHNRPVARVPRGAAQSESLAQPRVLLVVDEKPQKLKNTERTPDYFANVGDAIRTLREDIPDLFSRDLNYSIYREDIVFKDPRNKLEGIKNYKTLFWSLRFHGRIFFSRLYVEIKRIWQPQDDVIKMRWTIHGIPRVPWEAEGLFDGISTYKLDNAGRVYEHNVDNVVLRDPPMLRSPLNLVGLNLSPNVAVPQGQPCPGAWFMPLTTLQRPQRPEPPAAQLAAIQLPRPEDQDHASLWHTASALPGGPSGSLSHATHAHMPVTSDTATRHHVQHVTSHLQPAYAPAEPACPQPSVPATDSLLLVPLLADVKQPALAASASQPSLLQAAYLSLWVATPSGAERGMGGRDAPAAAPAAGAGAGTGTSTWSHYPGWMRLREALIASESLLGLQGSGTAGEDGTGLPMAARSLEPSPSR